LTRSTSALRENICRASGWVVRCMEVSKKGRYVSEAGKEVTEELVGICMHALPLETHWQPGSETRTEPAPPDAEAGANQACLGGLDAFPLRQRP
jgi:hypothetical protein